MTYMFVFEPFEPDGAAEEAGLMVGDYVLAVNGTDVTSVPHSEAADLAKQGKKRACSDYCWMVWKSNTIAQ